MAECQVHTSSVNNAFCFPHTTHAKCTEPECKKHKEEEASGKAIEGRPQQCQDGNDGHIVLFNFHMNHTGIHRAELCECA